MKKIIIVDIQNEADLIEKYNINVAKHSLINYLLKRAYFTYSEELEIIIHNKCNTKIDIKEKIVEGLKLEYELTIKKHNRNNILQLFLFFLGVFLLFLSTLIHEELVWKEILLISGWVPIWEMINIELFDESKGRKTKKIIEKLLNSNFKIETE